MGFDLIRNMVDKGRIEEGRRAQQYISGMWQYAVDAQLVPLNIFTRMRKINAPAHIQQEKKKTNRDKKRNLSDKEIYQFWHGTFKYCKPIPGAALRLMLLLGRRGADVRPMLKSEIDIKKKIWHMTPAKVREQKKENFIPVAMPLPPLAFDIVSNLITKATESDLMFPSPNIKCLGLPITQSALSQPINDHNRFDIIKSWTPHDLRKTASTLMSKLEIEQPIINQVLAHNLSPLAAIYNHNDFIESRRKALIVLNDHVYKIISGPEPK